MIQGFSKLTKEQKRQYLAQQYLHGDASVFTRYDNDNQALQQLHDDFIENTIANYYLPLGIAPNFLINGQYTDVPMAIEESSVVAGVSKAAKFWSERGGFATKVLGMEKIGQVHFFFSGEKHTIEQFVERIKPIFLQDTQHLTSNMQKRGGGIISIELHDKTKELEGLYQLFVRFNTLDAMGANFINSCLEQMAKTLEREYIAAGVEGKLDVLMSILSNYVPQCLVRCEVSCSVENMEYNGVKGEEFADNLVKAIRVAQIDPHRAVTHNKGVMNGIDAVVIATGNDFRAVEAGVHAYASRQGRYTSLTNAYIESGILYYSIELPLSVGVVGGLTKLHPMVKTSLQLMKNPTAAQLMQIMAAVGLAQNFAAVASLVTSGIQKGHMKMHLVNILNQLGATPEQRAKVITHFSDRTISHSEVVQFFQSIKA